MLDGRYKWLYLLTPEWLLWSTSRALILVARGVRFSRLH